MYHLRGSAWTTLEIRDEPAHVPGCFKMFTGKAVKYRGKTGTTPRATLSPPGCRWGDTGTFREHPQTVRDADPRYAPVLGR